MVDRTLKQFHYQQDALIEVLHTAQEVFGFLDDDLLIYVARQLKLPLSWVYGVATFYAQFRFTPTGENLVSICRGTACHVRGAPRIFEEVTDQLGLEGEGTTEDMKYTVETVACVGCCALAPVMTINEEVHGDLTKQKVRKLIEPKGDDDEK
jgi:NADH:ubiquinone oxidoreductase subunit E